MAQLDARKVALVQDSFARLAPTADAVAQEFYDRLFRAHPSLRRLFPTDMGAQREKLVSTLSFVVQGLGRLDAIVDAVAALGVRHVGYRAETAHYDAVGAALLETLEARLGAHWTPETAAAWREAYALLSQTMIDAAATAGADRAAEPAAS